MFTDGLNNLRFPGCGETPPQAENKAIRFHSQDGYHQAADVCTRLGNTVKPMINPGSKRSMDEASLMEFDRIPKAKRARLHRKIKAGVMREAFRKEAPVLAAAGAAWHYREQITQSAMYNTAKNLVQSVPNGIQFALSSQILAIGTSLRKAVTDRMTHLKDNVRFVFNFTDQTPSHLKNIVNYHALKTLFEEHSDKIPPEVRTEVEAKINSVEQYVNRHGGEYNYESFNKDERIRFGRVSYPNVESILNSIENIITSASQKERVSKVLDADVMELMLENFSQEKSATLKSIFDNLLIPAPKEGETCAPEDLKALENVRSVEDLVTALGKALSLSNEHTVALEKMIDFHLVKSDIQSIKSSIAEGHKKSNPLLSQIQKISEQHASLPSDSQASEILQSKVDMLYDELDKVYPHFPQSMLDDLDKLVRLGDESLLTHQTSAFDLNSFIEPSKDKGYYNVEHLDLRHLTTNGMIRSLSRSVHVLDVTQAMKQLIDLGSKPIKPFRLTGVMKAEIEKLLSDLAPDDVPLFIQKLESMETLASPYLPDAKKEHDMRPGIYLQGTPGIGKTTLLRELGKLTGLDIIDIKADELTIENLTKKMVECPSKNPMIIMDELGEIMSDNQRFLNSLARFVIDIDAQDRIGSFPGHVQVSLKGLMERIADWSTGNEEIADDKIKSRKTTCKLPGPSEAKRSELATAAYLNKLKPTGRKLIANDRRDVMFELFKQDLPKIVEKTTDLRVIKELAANYEVHQMRYFEMNPSQSFEIKAKNWPEYSQEHVLPNLDKVAVDKGVKQKSQKSGASRMMDFMNMYSTPNRSASRPSVYNKQSRTTAASLLGSSTEYGMSTQRGDDFKSLFQTKDTIQMPPPPPPPVAFSPKREITSGMRTMNYFGSKFPTTLDNLSDSEDEFLNK